MCSGVFIDPDRYDTEVPYARSVEEVEFVRQISAAADDRDLFRSTAIWDYRFLSNCALPVYDQFSTRDTRRPFCERRAERKRRHSNGLLVPSHAGEVAAITRSTAERIFPHPPSYLKELENWRSRFSSTRGCRRRSIITACSCAVCAWITSCGGAMSPFGVRPSPANCCQSASCLKVRNPDPFVQGIRSFDVLRVCNGQSARDHNLNSALGWIRRIRRSAGLSPFPSATNTAVLASHRVTGFHGTGSVGARTLITYSTRTPSLPCPTVGKVLSATSPSTGIPPWASPSVRGACLTRPPGRLSYAANRRHVPVRVHGLAKRQERQCVSRVRGHPSSRVPEMKHRVPLCASRPRYEPRTVPVVLQCGCRRRPRWCATFCPHRAGGGVLRASRPTGGLCRGHRTAA